MRFDVYQDLESLSEYLPRFFHLVDRAHWYRRVQQLDAEQQASAFLWKIVSDYHWMEMAISRQADVLAKEGRLLSERVDLPALAALQFAGAIVEIHARLSEGAQTQLLGRLRDGLKAESGFAAIYLEVSLALILMVGGYDVHFADLEGTGNYDIQFSRDGFVAEVECKSLSVDAGRRIHRKDFYRFVQALAPQLEAHRNLQQREILIIALDNRLSSNLSDQAELRSSTAAMLEANAPSTLRGTGFLIERRDYREYGDAPLTGDERTLYRYCEAVFGPNAHIAGGITKTGGCLVVMRCLREDDTSQSWLEAMRKASSQFTGQRPSFIAVQFQDITAEEVRLPHLQRRAGILSNALFAHHGADHVNGTYFTGFFSMGFDSRGRIGIPAFAIPNPRPKFRVEFHQATPFLTGSLSIDAFQ